MMSPAAGVQEKTTRGLVGPDNWLERPVAGPNSRDRGRSGLSSAGAPL